MIEWYSPSKITYTREEVIWLISVLYTTGYPPEHRESGYTELNNTSSHCASFETESCVLSEIEERLKSIPDKLDKVRKLLIDTITDYFVDYEFAQTIDYKGLPSNTKPVLNYISGFRRRDVCYYMWLFIKSYTKNGEKCKCGNRTWRSISGEMLACFKCGFVKKT